MQTAHIKLYVEMPDGMVIEHDTNKAPTALADAMQRMLMDWSQHKRLPAPDIEYSGRPLVGIAQTGAHQRAETIQKQVGVANG